MRLPCALLLFLVLASAESPPVVAESALGQDPFAFFWPSVVTSDGERQRLGTGGTVARIVEGHQDAIAVFSATPLDADGDRFVRWMRQITVFKKGKYVEAIGRFSSPPRIEDLAALMLDATDLKDLEHCRPRKCGLKLSGTEIADLRRVLSGRSNPTDAVQDAFRRLVLTRVQRYAQSGHRALADYEDRRTPVSLEATFSGLVDQSVFLRQQLPALADFLVRWPDAPLPSAESFFYWSKERLGAKAIISVTQVSILRGDGAATPDVVAVGKQIFATHYMDGSLSVTAIVGDGQRSPRYLAYLNRSDVDVLGGFWGGLVRRILGRRLRSDAPGVLQTLRTRLESGDPPE